MDIFELAKARILAGGKGSGGAGVVSISESTTPSKSLKLNDFEQVGALRFPNAESIGNDAFYNCTALTSVDLPAATSIGSYAFQYCTALTSVDLPAATSIGSYALSNCAVLTSVDLPVATSIGTYALSNCAALTSINLPVATSIGSYAFYKSTNLQAIILRTTETVCVIDPTAMVLDADENDNPTKLANFYVPASMYEYYRAAYEPAFEEYGFAGYFDVVFHKIEDLPEI